MTSTQITASFGECSTTVGKCNWQTEERKPRLPFHKPSARVIQRHSAARGVDARLKRPWLLSQGARHDSLHAPGVRSPKKTPCPVVAWTSGRGEDEAWRISSPEWVIITDIWHSDWAPASCVSALTPYLCMFVCEVWKGASSGQPHRPSLPWIRMAHDVFVSMNMSDALLKIMKPN